MFPLFFVCRPKNDEQAPAGIRSVGVYCDLLAGAASMVESMAEQNPDCFGGGLGPARATAPAGLILLFLIVNSLGPGMRRVCARRCPRRC